MPINLRALSIALILAGSIASPALAATSQDTSSEVLLRGAKKWADKDRADLAKNLLQKVLLIDPNSADALAMLGKIELKNGKPNEAQRYLTTLKKVAPDNPKTRELNTAYRLATEIPPEIKTAAKPVMTAPLNLPVKPKSALVDLGRTTKPAAGKAPERKPNSTVTKLVVEKRTTQDKKQTVADDVSLADNPDIIARTDALDALQDGNYDVAESALTDILTRRPQDQEILGGLGLLKQRQGKFSEAEGWFRKAVEASGGENPKWNSLVLLAEFWKHLRAASVLLDEGNLPQAEQAIQRALVLQPDEPNALTLRADIKSAENDTEGAEKGYRDILNKQGYNVSAIRGLTNLLTRTQRSEEALTLIEQTLQTHQSELDKDPSSHAGLLRQSADLYIASHRTSPALQALETAVKLDPKEPWARFSLAKLYVSLDLAPLGRRVLDEGVALSPKDPAMHYVRALVLVSLDDYAAAIDSLSQIPEAELTRPMLETRNRALIQNYFQQAQSRLAQGNRKEAIRIMSIAETESRGNYAATEQVAEGWFKLDLQKSGLSAMRKLPQPVPLATQVNFASLLNRAKQDQELEGYLPSLRIPDSNDEATKKYRATVQEIEFAMAGRHYDTLMKAGKTEQAQQFSDTIMNANTLSTSDYFRFHRSYFSRAQLPENAIALLNQEKEQLPDDLNLRYDLAYAYYQDKQNSNSQREIQELLTLTKSDDIDMRLRIASLQQSVGDSNGARQTVHDLTTRFPNNTDALFQAGNIARSSGKYDQAMRYYQKTKERSLQPQAASDTVKVAEQGPLLNLLPKSQNKPATRPVALVSSKESDSIYRSALAADTGKAKPQTVGLTAVDEAMNSIAAQRSAKIEAGLDIQSKTAGNGTSTYNSIEVPILARFPIGYEAHGTVQIDKISVDAGSLPAAFNEAALFGKIQPTQAALAAPLAQTVSGTSIGIGYEQSNVKADIGLVGQGFPVRNVVGGVRTGGNLGGLSYSLTLSRRPYTGSLLSYAGARDPVSGTTWGGVTNTGVSLYMSTTLSDFNLSGMGSYGLLRGQNVLNNSKLYLRAAIDKDIYTDDDTVLNIGLSANYTSFAKNQAFYTFGQGGYYSPQSSLSFSLPVELSGRADLLSYQVRASVSYSSTREDAAVFYPTDAALQAQAALGPNFPPGNAQAIYKGGTGGGFGYGLLAATEYRFTPNFALGGRFTMDRSAYYAPNALFFYGRYMFNPETGPVKMRPDPVTPYSQY
ncbi:MAG: cellulose synthase subunit BcsC-related outer membrane protein [Nitrosomonadales bacterium]